MDYWYQWIIQEFEILISIIWYIINQESYWSILINAGFIVSTRTWIFNIKNLNYKCHWIIFSIIQIIAINSCLWNYWIKDINSCNLVIDINKLNFWYQWKLMRWIIGIKNSTLFIDIDAFLKLPHVYCLWKEQDKSSDIEQQPPFGYRN